MCGIVGKIVLDKNTKKLDNYSVVDLGTAMSVQSHRGPDDCGVCGFDQDRIYEGKVAADLLDHKSYDGLFGFNRLSIRDLSFQGHQPMLSDDRRKFLLFNGEIYNDIELRKRFLEDIRFRGHSDTETILNLYEKMGFETMVKMLNGMFSIVLVDLSAKKVFIARDRFGIKPLYISYQNGCVYFASEIKSLIQFRDFKRELDVDAYYINLLLQKPGENLIMKNVDAVRPGSYTIIDLERERDGVSTHVYFDIDDYERRNKDSIREEDAIDELSCILRDAVKRQLISDVKVGCQISGGVDSSLISWYMADNGERNLIDGFSVIDTDRKYEEAYIDQVVDKTGLNIHKLESEAGFFVDNLEDVIWHSDVPIHKAYASEYFKIAQSAKNNKCTVLLSGEGADEITGGYNRIPRGVFQPFISSLGLHQVSMTSYDSYAEYALLTGTGYMDTRDLIPKSIDISLYIKEYVDIFDTYSGSDFSKYLKYECTHGLRDLLVRQDKMMMAHSIENRVPFLDNEVVDYIFTLPEDLLVRFADKSPVNLSTDIFSWVEGKYALKALAERIFGHEFAYRKKTAMAFNEKNIFRSDGFKKVFENRIYPGMKNRGLIDPEKTDLLYRNIENNTVSQTGLMWRAMTMELWCQLFIDGKELNV